MNQIDTERRLPFTNYQSPITNYQLPIRGFIFDLDGVLTDTAEYHYRAWKRLAFKFYYRGKQISIDLGPKE